MKRYIIVYQTLAIFMLLTCTGISFGQQTGKASLIKPDPRLYECLDKAYVDGLQSNPRLLLYYNFYLDNSYYISDVPEKSVDAIDITTVSWKNPGPNGEKLFFSEDVSKIKPGTFNPLKYDFHTQAKLFTNFSLGKTGKLLVFYSDKVFSQKYNEYLKSFNLEAEK